MHILSLTNAHEELQFMTIKRRSGGLRTHRRTGNYYVVTVSVCSTGLCSQIAESAQTTMRQILWVCVCLVWLAVAVPTNGGMFFSVFSSVCLRPIVHASSSRTDNDDDDAPSDGVDGGIRNRRDPLYVYS